MVGRIALQAYLHHVSILHGQAVGTPDAVGAPPLFLSQAQIGLMLLRQALFVVNFCTVGALEMSDRMSDVVAVTTPVVVGLCADRCFPYLLLVVPNVGHS